VYGLCHYRVNPSARPDSLAFGFIAPVFFFPWRSALVNDFRRTLRAEYNYKGVQPYWDWTLDASSDFPKATIFDDYRFTTGSFTNNFEIDTLLALGGFWNYFTPTSWEA